MAAMAEHSMFSHANFISKTELVVGADHCLGPYKYGETSDHLPATRELVVFVPGLSTQSRRSHICRSLRNS